MVRCGAQHPPRAAAAWTVAIFGSVCVYMCVRKKVFALAPMRVSRRALCAPVLEITRARARSRALTHTLNKRDNAGWSLTLTHSLTHVCTHTRASAKRKACRWLDFPGTQHSHRNDNTRATQTLAHKPEVGVTDVTSHTQSNAGTHSPHNQSITGRSSSRAVRARAQPKERAGNSGARWRRRRSRPLCRCTRTQAGRTGRKCDGARTLRRTGPCVERRER